MSKYRRNQLLHADSNSRLSLELKEKRLCLVGGSGNISSATGPVNVNVLSELVFIVGELWLDLEGVSTEVVSLSLEQVGRKILGTVTIKPTEGGAESRGWYSKKSSLGDNVSPSWLGSVDGFVEEVAEEQVLKVWILAVSSSDILQEN